MELISTYDLEGNFLSVNETTVRITGYPREALLKMNLSELAAPETRHLFPEYIRNIRTSGKVDGIMQIQTASGIANHQSPVSIRFAGIGCQSKTETLKNTA